MKNLKKTGTAKNNNKSKIYISRGERNVRYNDKTLSKPKKDIKN